jgi:tetratricopeptide (TPR) repeat protein
MADIRLQEYVAKIKDLIRDDHHDEAIVHCQHILRHYPKHIETYCLLGEACLERNMYREAIEFFQRALSADPESFISRVGLGIIYEGQGSLPEAIWQMERAFELTPGNAEVRRELQRLYTTRDGVEKARLKLTRGALGRLYARNGLYDRAIGEFQAILRQDPDSPDIRVALVEALWREGRRLEAVEICLDLLDALPRCLKANLILGEIWMRGGHEDAGEEKLKVARALDPENLVAQDMMGRESPLPLEDVPVPELEVKPDMLDVFVPSEVPAVWGEKVQVGVLAEGVEAPPAAEAGEEPEEIPDWLRDIGAIEIEEPVLEPEVEAPVEETVPAQEVPDWLQELMGEEAPPVAEEAAAVIPEAEEEEEEIGPVAEMPEAEVVEALPITEVPLEEVAPAEEIPDWLRELEEPLAKEAEIPPVAEAPVEEVAPVEEIPDWLREVEEPLAKEAEIPPVAEAPLEEVVPAEEIPDWLREVEEPLAKEAEIPPVAKAPLEEVVPAEEIPDWLRELEEPALAKVPESLRALVEAGILDEADLESTMAEMSPEELEAQRAEGVPEWLRELVPEKAPAEAEEVTPPEAEIPVEEAPSAEEEAEAIEEIPEWLKELVPEEAPPVAEAEPIEEMPEWLKEWAPEQAPEVAEELAPPEAEIAPEEVVPAEEIPAWLRELEEPVAQEVQAPPIAEVPVEEVAPAEEIPDWLREVEEPVAEEVEIPPIAEAPPEKIAPAEEVPEWLREVEEPALGQVPESLRALVQAGILDEADLESAMAEMSPEELEAQRAEGVPEWLKELVPEEAPPAAEKVAPPEAEIPVEEAPPVKEEAEAIEAIPTWLKELVESEAERIAPPPVVEAPVEEPAIVEVEAVPPVAEVPAEEPAPIAAVEAPVEEPAIVEEEAVPPVAEVPAEEPAPIEEAVEARVEEPAPLEVEAVPPVAEVPAEEPAPIEEKVTPPVVEMEAAPPFEALEMEEEVGPARADELLAQLKDRPRDYEARLELARLYCSERDWNAALAQYERLIAARRLLPAVIDDLQPLAEEELDQARLYQLLGDAYMQENQLDQALEMYRQARRTLIQH